MKFLDIAKVYASSGAGGNGCIAFRREKFMEYGGAYWGGGGRGGEGWGGAGGKSQHPDRLPFPATCESQEWRRRQGQGHDRRQWRRRRDEGAARNASL